RFSHVLVATHAAPPHTYTLSLHDALPILDARKSDNQWIVHTHGGKKPTDKKLFSWAKEGQNRGAGEILFTSMDNDGTKNGFALEDRKSTRLNSSHVKISYAVICLEKKNQL